MRKWGFVLAALLALASGAARADMAKFEAALTLFEAAALWRNAGTYSGEVYATGGIRRFNSGMRVFLGRSGNSSLNAHTEAKMREAAELAGLAIEFVDTAEKANVKFNFFQEYQAPPGIPGAGCVAFTNAWTTTEATVHVRLTQRSCVTHEIMHVFGFPGHPHELESVLSYTHGGASYRENYSPLDRAILRAMYRANLPPGTYHLPALVRVRQFLAEEYGVVEKGADTAHLGRRVIDASLAKLQKAADAGNPFIQMQLGNAYAFGHYVEKSQATAVRYWTLAASQKNAEAVYRLALAARSGDGVPMDGPGARARLREASDLGHGAAALAYARMLNAGTDGPAEPVEAFAYFDLAARRNQNEARSLRDALLLTFDDETKARAQKRAAELPTAPPR